MLIIENISGVEIEINDLGLSLSPNQTIDLTRECNARDVTVSGDSSGDLNGHISAGNVVVKDPSDITINLTISAAIDACQSHNDTHFISPARYKISEAFDVDITGVGDFLKYNSSTGEFELGTSTGLATAAPPDKAIQFNNNGSFGANANFIYNTLDSRVEVRGTNETNILNIGGDTLVSSGTTSAALYIEVVSGGTGVDGLVTYFNRNGTAPNIGGWVKYAYDGTAPFIGIVDEDDDPSYITFDTVGTGTPATPQIRNKFGSKGPIAGSTNGFSWKENDVEVATLEDGVLDIIGANAEYRINGLPASNSNNSSNLVAQQESGRVYCYTDDRWVTSGDDLYGPAYFQWAENAGGGTNPVQEWEHQGIMVNAGSKYKKFSISLRTNAWDVTEMEVLISYRRPSSGNTYAGGYINSDGEMENTTIHRDFFYVPTNGVSYIFNSGVTNRRTFNFDFDIPDDGWITVYFKPTVTGSSTRYAYITMTHIIDIGQI